MSRAVLVSALLVSAGACTHVNRATLLTSSALLACDWSQTRHAAAGGWEHYREANPVMGPTPTPRTVDTYFLSAAVLNTAIWYVLPESVRSVIPGIVSSVQAKTIVGNVPRTGWCW